MSKDVELLLLRHGKSDWSVPVEDFQRPLKKRGKRGAQRIGAFLAQHDLLPDYVISSPAERAVATAEKCVKAAGLTTDIIRQQAGAYEATPKELLTLLAHAPDCARRIMLVGHNPGLEMLLLKLCQVPPVEPEDGKWLPTATLAQLQFENEIRARTGKLIRIQRARELPEDFPWPYPNGDQRRPRPAYYYRQSSVVPYRQHQGELQILLTGSSSAKHIVLPKGIIEPGLSPAQSAAREALEEAGVEGHVHEPALGNYQKNKWGAELPVEVFAMQVTRELPGPQWEESHRSRRWVSVEKAIELLDKPALTDLIEKFAQVYG